MDIIKNVNVLNNYKGEFRRKATQQPYPCFIKKNYKRAHICVSTHANTYILFTQQQDRLRLIKELLG